MTHFTKLGAIFDHVKIGVALRQTLLKNSVLLLIPLLLLSAYNKDKATALSQCKTEITNEGIAEEKESAHWALCMKKHGYDLIRKNAPPMCQDIPLNTHANIDCYEPMPFKERFWFEMSGAADQTVLKLGVQ